MEQSLKGERIKVLIVDDHPVVREGLRTVFSAEADLSVVGEAGTAAHALELAATLGPDIVVADVRLPGVTGIQLTGQLRRLCPKIKVVILTTFAEEEYLFGAVQSGAQAYLLKSASPVHLVDAIRRVYQGERMIEPQLMTKLVERFEAMAKADTVQRLNLSPDEIAMLGLIAEGATNREIADQLHWAQVTVKRKLSDVFHKMGVIDRAQAVAEAMKAGLI